MTPWKLLLAAMQIVLAFGLFQGAFFSGWLAVTGGVILSIVAVLTLIDALRPLFGSVITLVGNRK